MTMLNADFRSLTLLGSTQDSTDSATIDLQICVGLKLDSQGTRLSTPDEKTITESAKFVREDGEWLCLSSTSKDWDRDAYFSAPEVSQGQAV